MVAPRAIPLEPTRQHLDDRLSRRSHVQHVAEQIEPLLQDHALDDDDQQLLREALVDGRSLTDIARRRRQPRSNIARRLRRLRERLTKPTTRFVLERRPAWPELRARIATHILLRGRSQRDTAQHLDVTLHVVRQELHHINTEFRLAHTTQ